MSDKKSTKKADIDNMQAIEITSITEQNIEYFKPFFPSVLHDDLSSGKVIAIGAIVESIACGVIAFEVAEEVANLVWIYIAKDYRREYIGSTLFCEMVDFFEQDELIDIRGIFCEYMSNEDNGLINFFESMRFTQESTDELTLSINLQDMKSCGFYSKKITNNKIVPFEIKDLSALHLNELNKVIREKKADYLGQPISCSSVDNEKSLAFYDEFQPVSAICFSDTEKSHELMLSVLYIDENYAGIARYVFYETTDMLLKRCKFDSVINIPIVNESSLKIVNSLFGDKAKPCEKMIRCSFVFGQ